MFYLGTLVMPKLSSMLLGVYLANNNSSIYIQKSNEKLSQHKHPHLSMATHFLLEILINFQIAKLHFDC